MKPSEADLKARDKALNDVVLKAWAKRCGDACAAKWTEIVGKKYGLTAKSQLTSKLGVGPGGRALGP